MMSEKVPDDPFERLVAAGRDLFVGDPLQLQGALRDDWVGRAPS